MQYITYSAPAFFMRRGTPGVKNSKIMAPKAVPPAASLRLTGFACMRRLSLQFLQPPRRERPEQAAQAERRPGDAPGERVARTLPAARQVERPAEHHRPEDPRADSHHRAHGIGRAEDVGRHALG